MNSAMWRSLCDEIPLEATPQELDAALGTAEGDSLTEDERAMIRYLAVLMGPASRHPRILTSRICGNCANRLPPRTSTGPRSSGALSILGDVNLAGGDREHLV
jgi:hypothetical protein